MTVKHVIAIDFSEISKIENNLREVRRWFGIAGPPDKG
jgi:hypothetical protein